MNAIFKRLLFIVAFVLLTLVLPTVILLLFVDSSENFGTFVISFGVITFGILGYIVSLIRDVHKKIDTTMDEIKMQNAAIAYKISNVDNVSNQATVEQPQAVYSEEKVTDTNNIPLNPPDPLVMPEENKVATKTVDDGFDDFK